MSEALKKVMWGLRRLNEKYAFHLPLIFALFLEKGWIWRCLWEIVAFAVTVFESITGKGGLFAKEEQFRE